MQDSYQQPIARMLDFFIAAYQENPVTTLEVFVHKAESLAEDYKIGTWSCDKQPRVHLGTSLLRSWCTSDGPRPPMVF